MIDLRFQTLQTEIEVNGKHYALNTDYRYWLDFADVITDLDNKPNKLFNLFKDDIPKTLSDWEITIEKLKEFYTNLNSTPKVDNSKSNDRLFDYVEDGEYIYASFFQAYKIDLLAVNMHWHLFLALFRGLPNNCKIKEIMNFRGYQKGGKSMDDSYAEAKRAWELPKIESKEDKERMDEINNMFFGC